MARAPRPARNRAAPSSAVTTYWASQQHWQGGTFIRIGVAMVGIMTLAAERVLSMTVQVGNGVGGVSQENSHRNVDRFATAYGTPIEFHVPLREK
jgi:hypothetical protein